MKEIISVTIICLTTISLAIWWGIREVKNCPIVEGYYVEVNWKANPFFLTQESARKTAGDRAVYPGRCNKCSAN